MATAVKKNVCLIVIDGWGISEETRGEPPVNPAPLGNYRGSCTDRGMRHTSSSAPGVINAYTHNGLHAGNAIKNAETPVMDTLAEAQSRGEYTTLDASGLAVGIPAGVMGNSEVGHFTIGTGRVVYQVWPTGKEGREGG